jgi:hypothetical protein
VYFNAGAACGHSLFLAFGNNLISCWAVAVKKNDVDRMLLGNDREAFLKLPIHILKITLHVRTDRPSQGYCRHFDMYNNSARSEGISGAVGVTEEQNGKLMAGVTTEEQNGQPSSTREPATH